MTVIINSHFESLEKPVESQFWSIEQSVENKYHKLNDKLIDIVADASFHHFKLMEFKATEHERLPSPTPPRAAQSPLDSPHQGE